MTDSAGIDTDLSKLTSRGGLYLGLRYGLGIVVSCGNMLVLTRWIGPHAYGLYVTALGLTSFLAALARGGIDTYLVRMDTHPDRSVYDVASTLIAVLSVALMLGGVLAAPLLIRWYGNRDFLPAYLATLVTVPLAGLAGPPTAKLERNLDFRAVAGIELGGQVLALVLGMALAWHGFGVWAPVFGLIAWQTWAVVAAMWTARLLPHVRFDSVQSRQMFSFGAGYSASQRVWQARTLVNPLLVGRFAGAEGVAFVALAVRIAEGLGFIRITAGRLAIAALSRLRHDPSRFQSRLESALKLQILALGPLLCLFALAAPMVVPRFLGSRWTPSLEIYPFVAAGVLVNSLYNLQASALFVAGLQWAVFRAYSLHVAILGITTAILLPTIGIAAYGWAEIAACGGYLLLHIAAKDVAHVSYRKLGWLVAAFVLPPFGLLFRTMWTMVLWIPLIALAGFEIRGFYLGARLGARGFAMGRADTLPVCDESAGVEA